MMGMSIVSPVIPDYALSFGVPFAMAGLLISGFGLARLLVDLPAGILSSRFGARRLMLLGLAIIAVSSLIAGFAGNYHVLLAARILEGAGSAIYMTTSLTAVTRLSPAGSRGVRWDREGAVGPHGGWHHYIMPFSICEAPICGFVPLLEIELSSAAGQRLPAPVSGRGRR